MNRAVSKILVLSIPVILIAALILISSAVNEKKAANLIGKPQFMASEHHGRVEAVFVKPGDTIVPGKEICGYVVTSPTAQTSEAASAASAVNVTVNRLEGKKFVDCLELPGIVNPLSDVEVSTEAAGKVIDRPVSEGSSVRKGDILYRIDTRDYAIAVAKAQSAFKLAELQFKRFESLNRKNAAPQASLDEASANYHVAKATLEAAALALERCTIKSPLDGVIDSLFVETGEVIGRDAKVARVIDVSVAKVIVGIPEKDIDLVRHLDTVDFVVPSIGNRVFEGKVHHVTLASGALAKVYPMEVHIPNPESRLLPGMIIKARVVRKIYDDAILLPIFQVIPGDDEYYTFVIENGKASKRIIELGSFQGRFVHITSGLATGDTVIDKGLRILADGVPVNDVGLAEAR